MLTQIEHPVTEVQTGPANYTDGQLTIDLDVIAKEVREDSRIADVTFRIINPGERVRIVGVLDVADARFREDGPTFPGIDGPPEQAGTGRTHILSGFQVVASGQLPIGDGGLMVGHNACIDFWGPGAEYGPFGKAITLAADIELAAGLEDKYSADDAVRRALLAISKAVGQIAAGHPGTETTFRSYVEREASDLPKVAYVYQIQSQKAPLQTFLYGKTMDDFYPTLVDPVEILDGALITGNHGLQTIPTISHLNNPIIRRLCQEDGKTLHLLPVVLMEGHQKTTALKQRSANRSVELMKYLGANAAILSQEGGGMSVVDQMLTISGAEAAGISCVGVTYEMAGDSGTDMPLIYFAKEARRLISTGNREERVATEAPDEVFGRATHLEKTGDLRTAVDMPLYAIYGSTSQVGHTFTQGYAA